MRGRKYRLYLSLFLVSDKIDTFYFSAEKNFRDHTVLHHPIKTKLGEAA